MIITQTPLRISFVGGGTDYPEYFDRYGGATIGTSIDKYTYITVSRLTKFFDYRIRISYSKTELCKRIDDIQHPSVRECLRFLEIDGGVEIAVVSDLPARTGLGSSSSFTVGLLHALHALKGEMVSSERLAEEAVYVERELIRERVGYQDQYLCACGGLSHLTFESGSRVRVTPLAISADRLQALQERLMMFYTGLQRSAHDVLEQQLERTTAGTVTPYLSQMRQLVSHEIDILSNGHDLTRFGEILHQGWVLKQALSDAVSAPEIDEAYQRARQAGAVGGKLLGAGGGGFLLLYAEPYNHTAVRAALSELPGVPFQFERFGSRLIFYRP